MWHFTGESWCQIMQTKSGLATMCHFFSKNKENAEKLAALVKKIEAGAPFMNLGLPLPLSITHTGQLFCKVWCVNACH